MTRYFVKSYFVKSQASVPDAPVMAAISFLLVSGAVFLTGFLVQFGPLLLEQGRQWAVLGGWSTPYASRTLPPKPVAALILPPKPIVRLAEVKVNVLPPIPPVVTKNLLVDPVMDPVVNPVVNPVAAPITEPQSVVKAVKPVLEPKQQKEIALVPAPQKKLIVRKKQTGIAAAQVSKSEIGQIASIDFLRKESLKRQRAALDPKFQMKPSPLRTQPPVQKPLPVTPKLESPKSKSLIKPAWAPPSTKSPAPAPEKIDLVKLHQDAKAGVPEAQFNLGLIYYLGDGAPKNLVKAYRWIELAAQQNDHRAEAVLKALHRSLPAPIFTSLVFPEPIIAEAVSGKTITPQTQPYETVAKIHQTSVNQTRVMPRPVIRSSAASRWPGMAKVSYWKPDVFILGNKPLR